LTAQTHIVQGLLERFMAAVLASMQTLDLRLEGRSSISSHRGNWASQS
jgi:hypothetical protein